MANETTKQMLRRCSDRRYMTRWIVGNGIDIGSGPDPLSKLADFFPLMTALRPWDLPDGDAMLMAGVADETFDFVHSSHCLEHLVDPFVALKNWIRICKVGGHVIVTIPDEDLYEQGIWPSTFNQDHKWTFTILKSISWSPRSINVVRLLDQFKEDVEVLKIEKLDSGFVYNQPRYDQSLNGLSESAIEFVLRKRTAAEKNGQPAVISDTANRFARAAMQHEVATQFAEAVDLHQKGRFAEARFLYESILAVDPGNLAVRNNLSLIVPPALAEMHLRQVLDAKPDYDDALINLSQLLAAGKRHEEAVTLLTKALEARPDHQRLITCLVRIYGAMEDFDAAADLLERTRMFFDRPDLTYCEIALNREAANRTDDAVAALDKALEANPESVQAHAFRGRQFWKKGDFPAGARDIAWIWRDRISESQIGLFVAEDGTQRRQDGRTIAISPDGGLGDSLQFVRYAALLKDLGARVVVESQPELIRLFRRMESVDVVYPNGQLGERIDIRLPDHNLIGAFRTTLDTIPVRVPYLSADPEEITAYRQRLEGVTDLRVGLFWKGASSMPRDVARSIPPALLAPLLALKGVRFYSLQKDNSEAIPGLTDWTAGLADMASTAALIENLDLVISVDSSTAHLAGALGRPIWLLNRFDSCWRWLEDRTDSPWYPTLRQFRQLEPRSWPEVIERVAAALQTLIAQRVVNRS